MKENLNAKFHYVGPLFVQDGSHILNDKNVQELFPSRITIFYVINGHPLSLYSLGKQQAATYRYHDTGGTMCPLSPVSMRMEKHLLGSGAILVHGLIHFLSM